MDQAFALVPSWLFTRRKPWYGVWLHSGTTLTHIPLLFPFQTADSDYDTPHVIMTYTALQALAILRDDFSTLDRSGLLTFLRACQREDGRFVRPMVHLRQLVAFRLLC